MYVATLLPVLFLVSMTIARKAETVHGKERDGVLGRTSWKNSKSDKLIARTDRAERVNKGFDMMVRCVNVLGRVDNFISDRTKNVVQKLHAMYREEHKDPRNTSDRRQR
ncbi:uncharacterized protein LOC143221837 [Lasioglossum baleicum]|uniref:uncharacterized protein LOC143221837 n=1 Tax=Lasioglossum baleicum TaxID=434251 RepID=UPI003FCD6F0A